MIKSSARLSHYRFTDQRMIEFGIRPSPMISAPTFDMHLPFELGIVLSGRICRYASGVYSEIPRGGIFFAGMLEKHGGQALEENSRTAVFVIDPDFFFRTNIPNVDSRIWLAPFNTPAERRPLLIDEEFVQQAEHLARLLAIDSSQMVKSTQIELSLLEILLHVNRSNAYNADDCLTGDDIGELRPAFELIYRSFHPVGTAEAAKRCKLPPERFSKLFVQATNLSFSKFSLRHRLNQVAFDLKNSHCSLDELSDKWGFSSKSHLLRRFKDHYNVTPASYRNNAD